MTHSNTLKYAVLAAMLVLPACHAADPHGFRTGTPDEGVVDQSDDWPGGWDFGPAEDDDRGSDWELGESDEPRPDEPWQFEPKPDGEDPTWDWGTDDDPAEPAIPTNLLLTDGCDDIWAKLKDRHVKNMERNLEVQLMRALDNKDEEECWEYNDADTDCDADGDGDGDGDSDGDTDSASEYSETNTQVDGVDEADFIKNTGSHIYILADGEFQVIDAWPADQAHVISRTPIEGVPRKMYVHDGRAVIYSSLGPVSTNDPAFLQRQYDVNECTYGYDCDFVGDGQNLKITVLDLGDLDNPVTIRETEFNGSYLNSRRIGDSVFTLTVFPELGINIQGVAYWPEELLPYRWECGDDVPFTKLQILAMFEELREKNRQTIEEFDLEATLPTISDARNGDTADDLLASCHDFFLSQAGDGLNLVTLAAFDLSRNNAYDTTTVLGRPGAVYASGLSLYIASRHYQHQAEGWFYDASAGIDEATSIHKFHLDSDEGSAEYGGSGVVKGRVHNQFAMDEHDEHLRIATTHGRVPQPDVHSTLSVLAEVEDSLEVVGQIDEIAPTEDIRSARFNGDVGFIVTFKKTDPLFVFDLTDPENPTIEGELKIPGYSTYMHMMDDDHILSIGYDADDHGSFAYFQGIQLQILDVSDLTDPRLIHKEIIGTRGSTSDAATNHLAFNYFKTQDRLAFPMTICEDGGGGSYGHDMTFSGLLVYEVTTDGGFEEIGGVPHEEPIYGNECGNWWTNSNSKVKRSIFMDDFVYSVALDKINISAISDLANPVNSIDLVE